MIGVCVAWLCGAAGQASAAPTVTAPPAPPAITLGSGTLSASVTVTGRDTPQPGATIDFALYGPGDALCLGTPVFESLDVPYPVTDDPVTSLSYAPQEAGTHRWRAAYSGDSNNPPATSACDDANLAREVLRATPTIATNALSFASLGSAITDSATVSGRVNPLFGTVEFLLYAAGDDSCLGTPIFTSTVGYPESGGSVTSLAFTPAQPGTYRWRAFYSGDANNAPAEGACGDPNEVSTVLPPPPPPPPPPNPPAPPPPVPPTEALACPPAGLATGAVYRGTHSQGRGFCFTVSPDFKIITSYLATNVFGTRCILTELLRYTDGIPIVNRTFLEVGGLSGTFGADRTARGRCNCATAHRRA